MEGVLREAVSADADAFTRLAREAAEKLAQERGRVGELEVIGRLVKLPRAGRAIVVGDIHGDLASLTHILRESRFLELSLIHI